MYIDEKHFVKPATTPPPPPAALALIPIAVLTGKAGMYYHLLRRDKKKARIESPTQGKAIGEITFGLHEIERA